jgi:hypothetical protein
MLSCTLGYLFSLGGPMNLFDLIFIIYSLHRALLFGLLFCWNDHLFCSYRGNIVPPCLFGTIVALVNQSILALTDF